MNYIKEQLKRKIKNILSLIKLLIAKPCTDDTEESRSFERYRRCAWTSVVMICMRGANIVSSIISVPITLKYLGTDLFGIWMILTSIIGFASFTDFGLGVGLRNSIIKFSAVKNKKKIKIYIGNSIFVLFIIASIIIILSIFIIPIIPWPKVIKCSDIYASYQIEPSLKGMFIIFAISLPVNQILNIASGFQRAYWGYGCYLVGRILSFCFILLCAKLKLPLWELATGYLGIPSLCLILGWIVFFIKCPIFIPIPLSISSKVIKDLFGIGIFSLLHHISYAVLHSSTIILIGNTINSAASVPYSVSQKLFGLTSIFSSSILMGLSVAIGDAWHSKKYKWIIDAIKRVALYVWTIAIIFCVLVIISGKSIILWWTKSPENIPSNLLLIICAIISCVNIYASFYSGFLIAMNYVKEVAIYQLICGIISILLGYIFGIITHNAILVVFSSLLGSLPCALCYHYKFNKLLTSKLNNVSLSITNKVIF